MTKKEDILNAFGQQIAKSVGTNGAAPTAAPVPAPTVNPYEGYRRNQLSGELPLEKIIPDPNQPRKVFDEDRLQQLADSIRQYGVLQPIRVRRDETLNTWIIISGENRWRASKLAQRTTIPCILVEKQLSEEAIRVEQLVENCQRSDLKPMEQATAMRNLIDTTGWTMERLGRELSLSKATVVRSLALLKLTPTVQEQIARGELTASVGYALSQVPSPDRQQKLAATIARRHLSRESALKLIENSGQPVKAKTSKGTKKQFQFPNGKVTVELNADAAQTDDVQTLLNAALSTLLQST